MYLQLSKHSDHSLQTKYWYFLWPCFLSPCSIVSGSCWWLNSCVLHFLSSFFIIRRSDPLKWNQFWMMILTNFKSSKVITIHHIFARNDAMISLSGESANPVNHLRQNTWTAKQNLSFVFSNYSTIELTDEIQSKLIIIRWEHLWRFK
jgi:hypothetical protein